MNGSHLEWLLRKSTQMKISDCYGGSIVLFFAIFQLSCCSEYRELQLFTTTKTTWHHGRELCESQGMKLLVTNSTELITALRIFKDDANSWKGEFDNFWTGLHRIQKGTDIFYWEDCTPLLATAWSSWGNQGDDQKEHCIRGKSGLNPADTWEAKKCKDDQAKVICERRVSGPCPFSTIKYKLDISGSTTVHPILHENVNDIGGCQDICRAYQESVSKCWGVQYQATTCTLYTASDLMEFEEVLRTDSSTIFYLKSCYTAAINVSELATSSYIDKSDLEPWTGCLGALTSTAEPTTQQISTNATSETPTGSPPHSEATTTSGETGTASSETAPISTETTGTSTDGIPTTTTVSIPQSEATTTSGETGTTSSETASISTETTGTSTDGIPTTTTVSIPQSEATTTTTTSQTTISSERTSSESATTSSRTITTSSGTIATSSSSTIISETTSTPTVTNPSEASTGKSITPEKSTTDLTITVPTSTDKTISASTEKSTPLIQQTAEKTSTPVALTTATTNRAPNTPSTTRSSTIEDSMSTHKPSPTLCRCQCRIHFNLTEEKENLIEIILSNLTIDVTKVSATRRKYISAHDPRTSAQAVGCGGIVVLSLTLVVLFLLDYRTLARDFVNLWHNVCGR